MNRRRLMIDSKDFAKYIVATAQSMNISLNLTQLQKITYICDGVLLAYGHNIVNENCRVWDYGPVYPKVYKWYSKNMGKKVSVSDIKADAISEINETPAPKVVRDAVTKFSRWTSVQLSEWSHQKGSPWDIARVNNGMYSKIDKMDMRNYFIGVGNDRS